MGDKKNIDRIFREKFKHFESVPDAHVWSAIEAKLGTTKPSRGIFALIIRYAGVAAAILLLITLGYNSMFSEDTIPIIIADDTPEIIEDRAVQQQDMTTNSTPNTAITDDRSTTVKNDVIIHATTPQNPNKDKSNTTTIFKSNTVQNQPRGEIAMQYRKTDNNIDDIKSIEKSDNTTRPSSTLPENNIQNKELARIKEKRTPLSDIIQEQNDTKKDIVAQHTISNKWSINTSVAPVYFGSLNNNSSPVDERFSDNSKSGNITISYGVNIAYQINNRISVRSGFNKVNYGYTTRDLTFSPELDPRPISTIVYKDNAKTISINDVNTDPLIYSGSVSANKAIHRHGKMIQEFEYVEIPVEVKYMLLNKKLGIHVIGGLSSLFLTDNTISLRANEGSTQIGQANNINPVNFSTNIGIGIDYEFYNKILFTVEPIFKYQLSTFSDEASGFRPYSLGVYTGLSFRF